MRKSQTAKQHPHPEQHMVSGSAYYRDRADIGRGLKKKDFPSIEQEDPSQEAQDKAVDKDKTTAGRIPAAKH